MEEREAVATSGVDNLEILMVILKTKVQDRSIFQPARKTCEQIVGVQAENVPTNNRFNAMLDGVQDDPCIILVGDSPVIYLYQECKGYYGTREKSLVLRAKIDMQEKSDDCYELFQGNDIHCSGKKEQCGKMQV